MSRAGEQKRVGAKRRSPQQETHDDALHELLDHLGRLLAEEYVERMRESLPDDETPSKGETR